MPLPQKRGDLGLGVVHAVVGAGGDHDHVHVVERRAADALLDRGKGRHNDVVLVLAEEVGPLGRKHADDLEGDALDPHQHAQAIAGLEQIIRHGGAHDTDFGRPADVRLVEEIPMSISQLRIDG